MLVVLALIGLISMVLLTGLERTLDIRLRLISFLDDVEAPALVADWFRGTVGGLIADAPSGTDRFVGEARRMTGLSLAPLAGAAGVPTRVTWEVVFNDQTGRSTLRYQNSDDPAMNIASWPGNSGGLRYCAPDLHCGDAWPPGPRAAQLPALVELLTVKGSEPWVILAAPLNDRGPPSANAAQP